MWWWLLEGGGGGGDGGGRVTKVGVGPTAALLVPIVGGGRNENPELLGSSDVEDHGGCSTAVAGLTALLLLKLPDGGADCST